MDHGSAFRCRRWRHSVDSRDEAVPSTGSGFYEPRDLGRIAQRVTQTLHRRVQAVLEVDERIRRPKPLAQLFARDQFAGALQQ